MPLNQNHTFEDLGDVKCSIVEKNCSAERVSFLKSLLEFNKFTVVVVSSPPPKVAAKPIAIDNNSVTDIPPAILETFTIGVTDLTFNPIKAIYNRELNSPQGKIILPDSWKQMHTIGKDWYWA